MVTIKCPKKFAKTETFFQKLLEVSAHKSILDKYGQRGVEALRSATPIDSGATAAAWGYYIETTANKTTLYWTNDNINDGVNIAIILQYGHGTNNGGYVQGIDYINPSVKSIFEEIANEAWEEVKNT